MTPRSDAIAFVEKRIAAPGTRSLAWYGDSLVDWIDGGRQILLDGGIVDSHICYGDPFDAVVALPGSDLAVIHVKLGTKGLVLSGGQLVREINRSYYHADDYEYPVALGRLRSGRAVLLHCPNEYNRLEIEDLLSGELLTASTQRQPSDFFHSRLSVSPDGRYLVSAGWVWHPVDNVKVFDIEAALADPAHLDGPGVGGDWWADQSSAAWWPDGRLAVALCGWDEEGAPQGITRLHDVELRDGVRSAVLDVAGRLGTLMPVGSRHVLALHGHPRLLDIETGHELASWPHLKTGTQTSSILIADAGVPPMAVDAQGMRFAVADDEGISLLQFRL